jgi:hypothetical protein
LYSKRTLGRGPHSHFVAFDFGQSRVRFHWRVGHIAVQIRTFELFGCQLFNLLEVAAAGTHVRFLRRFEQVLENVFVIGL